jgi:NitT/TauT family transport system ATP-binding protein
MRQPTTVPTESGTAPIIELSDVTTAFGQEKVLDEVSFDVRPGEFLCLLGPSGCGKSTSLRLIGGLLPPNSGHIEVAGQPPETAWTELTYVFQQPRLLPWRTVLANVMLGMELRGTGGDRTRRQARAAAQLELVGLAEAAGKYPGALSGGERQRVAIARALALDPQVILMDEPLSALDVSTKQRLRAEIQNVWAYTGKTVVFVTHDISEALFLADRIIVFSGKPTRILREFAVSHPRPREVDSDPVFLAMHTELRELFGVPDASADAEGPRQ